MGEMETEMGEMSAVESILMFKSERTLAHTVKTSFNRT